MTYRLKIEAHARADIKEAIAWYRRIHRDLARRIKADIYQSMDRLLENPHSYPMVSGSVRKMVLQQFSYHLFYEIVDQTIVVLAILHSSRYPRFGHH